MSSGGSVGLGLRRREGRIHAEPQLQAARQEPGEIELGCGFHAVFSGEWAGPWVPHAASNQSSSALV